ncbi:hypothetical protein CFC21_090777 [Triticum aestivum]|uniref:Uncharacterized protein n=2 Tax=Triticum aestivum TaxID=4565 RepID=A0A3B6QB60_WHEAT|nr:hypothetical protein CFC21_090777 [Triticum aestivum]
MADTSGAPSDGAPITMKLLVDSRPPRPRVVFAEAGKDAVDFLFSLLTLPAGTAVRLLGKESMSMAGSVGNLYASVERLEGSYLRPGFAKDALLCPAVRASPLLRLPPPPAPAPRTFFTCGPSNKSFNYAACRGYVSDARGARCPSCGSEMAIENQYVPPPPPAPARPEQSAATVTTGFVQGAVTYTVTDDLAVAPMSAISSIARLGALAALQERTVQLGYKEGLEIVKASLRSKTVLTDVFLCTGGKKPPPSSKNGNGGTRYECLAWRV